MREFDLVKKTRGASDIDMLGLVLKITINSVVSEGVSQIIVTVLTPNGIKNWYQPFLDVMSQHCHAEK